MNKTAPFDSNGNTQTKVAGSNTTTLAWDFENRLTSVTLPGTGGTVSFKYDPFGRRIYKSSSSGTSIYTYDSDRLLEETNGTGAVVARYTEGLFIDEPLAVLRSAATSYYHADGLGSVTSLSNAAGALAQTYTFDSFGKLTGSSGSLTNPFQYTAREFDSETSLYYYRARYYDPNVGRFLREDPLRFTGGINFYAYVSNQPSNLVDPYGLWPSMGDIWNWAKGAKGAWDKTKAYAGRINCLATYYLCIETTFDNLESLSQAKQGMPRPTPDDLAHPTNSQELQQIRDCVAGNKNCGKPLEDCLDGLASGGILPH